ncbi:MAG: hypothetical protein WCE75_11460 [Terracidiphilus sp.]
MKPDLYTKAVLTVIAFMLVLIGCRDYVNPPTTVKAEGPFAGVQFSTSQGEDYFFDTRTGDVWQYHEAEGQYKVFTHAKLSKLGDPGASSAGGR